MSAFTRLEKIRFAHCDSAGIVFYPRYFELISALQEDWFTEKLGADFQCLHFERGLTTPTVRLDVTFVKPSFLGEQVQLSWVLRAIGQSSFQAEVTIDHASERRVTALITIVIVDQQTRRSIPIPEDLRARMEPLLMKENP